MADAAAWSSRSRSAGRIWRSSIGLPVVRGKTAIFSARGDEEGGRARLELEEPLGGEDLAELDRLAGDPRHDDDLLGQRRVADEDFEHEAVELRFWQRVGAVRLDR